MELPANVRRGLLAHSEGLSWIEAAKVANLTPNAMRQWRKHPDADGFLQEAIRSNLEQAHTLFADAAPRLAERLIALGLDERVKGYTAVSAISEAFKILQKGFIDKKHRD